MERTKSWSGGGATTSRPHHWKRAGDSFASLAPSMFLYEYAPVSPYNPKADMRRYPDSRGMPMTESLKDTEQRVMVGAALP